ncbi:MAG: adenosylmethionine--8-amino-7-oxononanoate transaminase [Nitrospirota bacterium]|nr:MAG: adenosylmethionine--8-amino-7-oxononanoate transaminase [Nitrospirota bacterium]
MGNSEEKKRLQRIDREHIWHPFTQMKDWIDEQPVIISEAKGCFVRDINGRWYMDGVSSLWVNIHGHRREEINNAIKAQLDKISHSTLLGLANVPSIELAARVIDITPKGLNKVFYSDNGSTSVEVALKMAFQYWRLKGEQERDLFIALKESYHGDTIGAVSLGGIDIFHAAYGPLLFRTLRAPSPYCYRCQLDMDPGSCKNECLDEMERLLRDNKGKVAGIVLEPLVQGAGGMICHPEGYLRGVKELSQKYDTLLILDEVATGFGRTGRMFACEHEGIEPDILCLSKGITGGYLPLAVTVSTDDIYDAFLGEYSELKTFFHGHSYTGNQLGCAAAIASLEIFKQDDTLKGLQPKIEVFRKWMDKVIEFEHVGDARAKGLMGGVELVKDKKSKAEYPLEDRMGWKVVYKAREKGLLLRPLGNVIVIMPPLVITKEDLEQMLDTIAVSVREVTG